MAFYAAIATDTIRLGPTGFDLPSDAMSVTVDVLWQTRSVNSTMWDFYSILVTVHNNVFNASVQPYGLEVQIPLTNASLGHWWPSNPIYQAFPWSTTADDGKLLLMPAGQIIVVANPSNPGQGPSWIRWSVQGDTSAGNVPIMNDLAQFYLEDLAVAKGTVYATSATATLTWDYHGSLQTYPVASRTMTVGFVMRSAQAST